MDNDSKSTSDEAYWTAYIILTIFIGACLYSVCTFCIHKNDDIENNAIEIEPRSTTITTTTANAAPQVEGNESELKNQRREYILTNVIWKVNMRLSAIIYCLQLMNCISTIFCYLYSLVLTYFSLHSSLNVDGTIYFHAFTT